MAVLISRRVKSYFLLLDHQLQFLHSIKSSFCSVQYLRKGITGFSSPKLLHNLLPVCQMCSNSLEIMDDILVKITEEENEYYHSFLEKCPKYNTYLLKTSISNYFQNTTKNEHPSSLTKLRKSLENVAYKSKENGLDVLTEQNVQGILKNWRESSKALSDTELFHDMSLFTMMNLRHGLSKSFRPLRFSLANTFNHEFSRRSPLWDMKTSLLAMDIFYHLRCYHVPNLDFIDKFFHKMNMTASILTNEEIILIFFYANLRRKCPDFILNKLTKSVMKSLDSCSHEEVAILCLGHFKCNNLRTSPFHAAVCQYFTDHSLQMESLTISAMAKFLNSASHDGFFRNLEDRMKEKLLVNLGKKVGDCEFSGVFHVISMCEQWRCVTPQLVSHLEHSVNHDNVKKMRVKDLAKASMLIGNLSPMMKEPMELLDIINKELLSADRSMELSTHFHNLCMALDGMTRAGVYPADLIQRLFDKNASEYFNAFELNYQESLERLIERIRIEHKEVLNDVLSNSAMKIEDVKKNVRLSNARIEFTKDVKKILSLMLADGHLKETKAFSNDNPDIEVRVTENGVPIPVEKWDGGYRYRRILFVLQSTKDFYKVFLNDGLTKYQIKGYSNMKLRQLHKLEFIPIPIIQYNYYTSKVKEDYIKQQVLQYSPDQKITFKETGFKRRRSYR